MNPTPLSPSEKDLALLSQIVRDVTRSRRLSTADAQDFAQNVQVRLLERDYDIFRRFNGRSTLRTYLIVVVTRMLLDWLNSAYGKWRPSAVALRLGEPAIRLERLTERDGHTLDQAIAIMCGSDGSLTEAELRRAAQHLPRRQRRLMVPEDVLDLVSGVPFVDPLEAAEQQNAEGRIGHALMAALGQLSADEQRLIRLRYQQNLSVQALAKMLSVQPKTLYRRFDRTLRSLRRALVAAGVSGSTCFELGERLPQ